MLGTLAPMGVPVRDSTPLCHQRSVCVGSQGQHPPIAQGVRRELCGSSPGTPWTCMPFSFAVLPGALGILVTVR